MLNLKILARAKLADFSLQNSLKNYSDAKELTPEEQFVSDFPENFETMTFSKVGNDNNVTKYKTTRFLKDDKIADLIEILKDSSDRKSIVNNDIKLNKQLFCKNLPKDAAEKVEKIEIKLNNEQIQDYIAGRLIHAAKKDITDEHTEIIDLLKSKGFDITHKVNGVPLMHLAAVDNSKLLKRQLRIRYKDKELEEG